MSINIPPAIASYFASTEEHNFIADAFTTDATVKDEGHTHVGPAAIREWSLTAQRKYQHTTQIIAIRNDGDKAVVRGLVSGNFFGSPAELTYVFTLTDGRISSLQIG